MKEFLETKGVEAELHIYGEQKPNELGHVFHCDVKSEDAKVCNDEECEFFRRHVVK